MPPLPPTKNSDGKPNPNVTSTSFEKDKGGPKKQTIPHLARALIGFIFGAMLGGGIVLYAPQSSIASVFYASVICGLGLAIPLACSATLFQWFEKVMAFIQRP